MNKILLGIVIASYSLALNGLFSTSINAQDNGFNSQSIQQWRQQQALPKKVKKREFPPVKIVFPESKIQNFIQDLRRDRLTGNYPNSTINYLGVDDNTPLAWLSAAGEDSAVKRLLDLGANPNLANNVGMTPLAWAATFGHNEIAKLLINNKAAIDAQETNLGATPLMLAVSRNHLQLVDTLLSAGADPFLKNKRGTSAASMAVLGNSHSMLKLFQPFIEKQRSLNLINGFQSPELSSTAGMIINKNQSELESRIAQGININQTGEGGLSLLFISLLNNNKPAFNTLLNAEANPNLLMRNRVSPIFLAAQIEDSYYLKKLLEKGGNPNISNIEGITPLMQASNKGYVSHVELLLKNNALISAVDNNGNTALSYAIISNNSEIVNFLLQNGIDSEIKDKSGVTAKELAEILQRKEILNFLK